MHKLFIGLRKEVVAYTDGEHNYLYNPITDSYRILSRKAAIFVFLIKECCQINTIVQKFLYVTGDSKINFRKVLFELSAYIKVDRTEFETGINNIDQKSIYKDISISNILLQKFPRNIFIRLTNQCDKVCKYCCEKDRMSTKSKEHFDKNYISKLFFTESENNLKKINYHFTGGEPLMYNYFNYIIEEFQQREMEASLITKAIDSNVFSSYILNSSLKYICFSLDSYNEQYVTYITGNKEAFRNMVSCMEIAKHCGKYIGINVVVTTLNKNCLEDMVLFSIRNMVDEIHFNIMRESGESTKNLMVNLETQKNIYKEIIYLQVKYDKKIKITLTMIHCKKGCKECEKALTDLKINYDGEVALCNDMVIGNLKDNNLQEIWFSKQTMEIKRLILKQMAI